MRNLEHRVIHVTGSVQIPAIRTRRALWEHRGPRRVRRGPEAVGVVRERVRYAGSGRWRRVMNL
nr:hypothetical protein KPHV_53140 [Kitasatospora purpeofusca]